MLITPYKVKITKVISKVSSEQADLKWSDMVVYANMYSDFDGVILFCLN